ncbi:MAG: DinB family protein [Planctomycetaceae bacterium]|nr:DinB family protein [Planctomycetaceae bacterium]
MLNTFKELIANQFEAAFCMLKTCIDRCPDAAWNAPVANLKFCQVAFHTLFFADFYLGQNADALRRQSFHRDHQPFFRDYEELENRVQVLLYDKPSIKTYLEHCRKKAAEVIAAETAESLAGPSGFERRTFSRAELHVLNIRHIQHHTAQLSLRLRIDSQQDIPWTGSGWRVVIE